MMQNKVVSKGPVGAEKGTNSSTDSVDFSEVVRLHWRQVFRICLRITRNEHDAEDAAQDCFLRAFSHFHQFLGKSQFSTWLHSIARNCSLMLLRKRRGQEIPMHNSLDSNGELVLLEPADTRPDQLSRFLYAEHWLRLTESIAVLPGTLRTTAELVILKERPLQEVCKILDISHASVKSRLYRARRRMSRFEKTWFRAHIVHRDS